MTKQEWQRHIMAVGAPDPAVDLTGFCLKATEHQHADRECPSCKARAKTLRAARNARAKHQAYLDAGLVRVRGALGGIYYE